MSLVVYAEPSGGTNPGHMVVGQECPQTGPGYFGFRFDPDDLPAEYRPPEQWRYYLFDHAIPGLIVDETRYVELLLADLARTYYEKRADFCVPVEPRLPPRHEWSPHAWYSFNPDDLHPECQPCYNCVKWAISITNKIIDGFLPNVRQGRVKLILDHLIQRDR